MKNSKLPVTTAQFGEFASLLLAPNHPLLGDTSAGFHGASTNLQKMP